jgi:neutral trehalase
MKKTGFFVILLITQFLTQAQTLATPDKIYAELFTDVQQSGIFPDSKTFVDAVPKKTRRSYSKPIERSKRIQPSALAWSFL